MDMTDNEMYDFVRNKCMERFHDASRIPEDVWSAFVLELLNHLSSLHKLMILEILFDKRIRCQPYRFFMKVSALSKYRDDPVYRERIEQLLDVIKDDNATAKKLMKLTAKWKRLEKIVTQPNTSTPASPDNPATKGNPISGV